MSYYRPRQREDRRQYHEEDREEVEEKEGVKPYTAVGAMLDSASRFKRRMNYGRVQPKR